MQTLQNESEKNLLRKEMETTLMERYGPLLGGENLSQALGFPSYDAFRQSDLRKQLVIPVFKIDHRRGRFALTRDVALWLATQRINLTDNLEVIIERE
jgi:hypothetical protein